MSEIFRSQNQLITIFIDFIFAECLEIPIKYVHLPSR